MGLNITLTLLLNVKFSHRQFENQVNSVNPANS